MLKTPTVFVLGAGAHVPYGMPAGKGLTSKIIDMLPIPGKSTPVAGRMHHFIGAYYSTYGTRGGQATAKAITDFRHKLRHSLHTSIDSFLRFYSNKPGFSEIGKLAVAMALLPLEFQMTWERGLPKKGLRVKLWVKKAA